MIHKTISVKQPWAYLLCAGIKDIENRTWKLPEKYKGERVLIHASSGLKSSISELLTFDQFDAILSQSESNQYDLIKRRSVVQAVIGSVRFVDCVINHESIWAEKCDPLHCGKSGKIIEATYNWVVEDPILFKMPTLNVKGRLNFWDFDFKDYGKNKWI